MPNSNNRPDSYRDNRSRSTGKKPAFKSDRKGSDKPRFDKKESGDRKEGFSKKFDKPFKKRDGDGEKRSYRDKDKAYGDDKKPFRKKFGEDKGYGDKKRSFGSDDKKPFRKKFGEDKSYGEKRNYGDKDKKPFRKRDDGDGEKKSYGDRDKKPFRKREDGGGEKRKFGDRDKKPFRKRDDGDGEKKSYGDRDKKPFYKKRDDDDRDSRKHDKERGDKKPFFKKHDDDHKKHHDKHDDKKRRKFKPHGKKHESKGSDDFLPNPDGLTRLNKYLSNAGICSRREADDLIKAGTVSVNGKVITEMGFKVGPTDKITYAGETLRHQKKIYLMLNKPKDYITTTDDPQERRTVMELIAGACKERVYPVGRLDRNTTGLLLFTNDGELATKLMHPKFGIKKVYQVTLDKNLKTEDYQQLMEGVELEDGFIKPDELSYINGNKKELGIEIHSGRNRIVRRIFEHIGYDVIKLDRVVFAGLTKKDLPRAKWRFLTEKEVGFLKMIG